MFEVPSRYGRRYAPSSPAKRVPTMTKAPHERETELQRDLLGAHGIVTRACPTLTWSDSAGKHAFSMTEDKAVVGSRPGVDVPVADASVSRLHAELTIRENFLWVLDLGSTNGTYVEGLRVTGARVPDGGVIRVGNTDITVHLSAPPVPVDLWPEERMGSLVGKAVVSRALFAAVHRLAQLEDPVLIQGETGTGKDEVARAMHLASARKDGPFVVVDCGALSDSLLESELFGHVRGAFTGADEDHEGSIEAANGGTVFLDEVGELPLELQPKLLRAVEMQSIRRVGETEYRKVNVRFVSATHQNLREMVNAGTFREDLYFRLAVFALTVPPLRDRREDIPLLIQRFLPATAEGTVTPELLRILSMRPWRGNVRELRNFVTRAQVLGVESALEMSPKPQAGSQALAPFTEARDQLLAEFERTYIADLLRSTDGNVGDAATKAGVTPSYLYRMMRKHQL